MCTRTIWPMSDSATPRRSAECLSRPGAQGHGQQHWRDPRSQYSHGQSSHRSAESRNDAARHVRDGHLPRPERRRCTPIVPASAILHMHDRDCVFVPAPDKKFRRVEVVSGDVLPRTQLQEIKSGLKPGQQVVTNALVLRPHDRAISEVRFIATTGISRTDRIGNDSRPRRFCAEQPVCGAGACGLAARLGSDLVSQPAGRGLSRHRRQLCDGHYPMAGPVRGGSGTAGHDSDRNSDERDSASHAICAPSRSSACRS